jgi:hypothetical protein
MSRHESCKCNCKHAHLWQTHAMSHHKRSVGAKSTSGVATFMASASMSASISFGKSSKQTHTLGMMTDCLIEQAEAASAASARVSQLREGIIVTQRYRMHVVRANPVQHMMSAHDVTGSCIFGHCTVAFWVAGSRIPTSLAVACLPLAPQPTC